MANKTVNFAKKYTQSLVALGVGLIVFFFVLNQIHTRLGSNVVGTTAGKVGSLASGQAYQFGN